MGISIGKLRTEDGRIFFFQYQNTVDIADARLFNGRVEEPAVSDEDALRCLHHQTTQPAMLWVDYGGGYVWLGTVCDRCLRIVQGRSPFDSGVVYDWTPPWAIEGE